MFRKKVGAAAFIVAMVVTLGIIYSPFLDKGAASNSKLERTIKAYYEARNKADTNEAVALFRDDFKYVEYPYAPQGLTTKEELRTFLTMAKQMFPNIRFEIRELILSEKQKNGVVLWNLYNESGNLIARGSSLFHVENGEITELEVGVYQLG
jgi:SnoaL-like polyketide cyclase.